MSALLQPLLVEIGPGELLDRITILEIKCVRFRDAVKRAHVQTELEALLSVRRRALVESTALTLLIAELRAVNERLWDVEDALRECERVGDFGDCFVALARSVYHLNDHRAQLKRRLNELYGSSLMEEKEYAGVGDAEAAVGVFCSDAGAVAKGQ